MKYFQVQIVISCQWLSLFLLCCVRYIVPWLDITPWPPPSKLNCGNDFVFSAHTYSQSIICCKNYFSNENVKTIAIVLRCIVTSFPFLPWPLSHFFCSTLVTMMTEKPDGTTSTKWTGMRKRRRTPRSSTPLSAENTRSSAPICQCNAYTTLPTYSPKPRGRQKVETLSQNDKITVSTVV